MISIKKINDCIGIEIKLKNTNLVLILAEKGYIMCGYLNLETAEKLGDVACVVRGVKTVEELLEKEIEEITENARKLGIKEGMKAKDALKLLSSES
ncbi:MAG TPA: DUF1805 domain-containing protein [Candidatus Altiarchaeales archaeon]|nr:DUF1805 domain-containing protein [Candidatus Altiarchaeales archaeon]